MTTVSETLALDPAALRIVGGHLVEATDDGNYGGTLRPLMTVAELAELIQRGAPVLPEPDYWNLRDVTAAAADRILDAAPEFGPLPDALSDEPPTDLECQLLADAGCNLDPVRDLPPGRQGVTVRALRAGHEAGRVSVLHRPVPARTWSNMHAPGPDEPVTTLTVVATAPGDAEVQLYIDGPDDVCLDREQAAELIADLQARFAVIDQGGSL